MRNGVGGDASYAYAISSNIIIGINFALLDDATSMYGDTDWLTSSLD